MAVATILRKVSQYQRLLKAASTVPAAPTRTSALPPLLEFIPRITPRFASPHHLKPLISRLERIPREPQFLIVSVPPRHSKSESLLHFMALLLAQSPELRIAYSTYAQTFSETQALKAHRYALAAGVQVSPTMANRKDWQTTAGGGIFATGVGGELTGRGADLLVIDDPVSNRDQANSPTYRNKVWACSAHRDQHCRRMARGGENRVRGSWGVSWRASQRQSADRSSVA